MKLIKIDPIIRKVSLIDTDSLPELSGLGKLEKLQHLVTNGAGGLVERLSEVVRSRTGGVDLLGDEEALLKHPKHFFLWSWNGQDRRIFCGTALLIGVEFGEYGTDWCSLSLVDKSHQLSFMTTVRRSVQWLDAPQALAIARAQHAEVSL